MENIIGKTGILIDNPYSGLIGKTFTVLEFETNENGHIILCTDIPHPDENTTYLWVNISDTNLQS